MRFKTIPSDDMAVLVPCTDVGKKPASFSGGDTNQQRGQAGIKRCSYHFQ